MVVEEGVVGTTSYWEETFEARSSLHGLYIYIVNVIAINILM
jgi:hypothetical protein